jgi:hypothetical protein
MGLGVAGLPSERGQVCGLTVEMQTVMYVTL